MPTWPFSTGTTSRPLPTNTRTNPSERSNPTHPSFASPPRDDPSLTSLAFHDVPFENPATSPRRLHARSGSSSLPAIFGGLRRKSSGDELTGFGVSIYDGNAESSPSPKSKTQKTKQKEAEMEAGSCATCNSRVKWPKGITEFRCSTCLMINDLKPSKRKGAQKRKLQAPAQGPDTDVLSDTAEGGLSVPRTSLIVDRCITQYLQLRKGIAHAPAGLESPLNRPTLLDGVRKPLNSIPRSSGRGDMSMPSPIVRGTSTTAEGRKASTHGLSQGGSSRPQLATTLDSWSESSGSRISSPVHQSPTRDPASPRITRIPPPTRKPSLPSERKATTNDSPALTYSGPGREPTRQEESPLQSPIAEEGGSALVQDYRTLFKPLEDYISHEFGDVQRLNHAFLTKAYPSKDATSSGTHARTRPVEISERRPQAPEAHLSELDAKTILLGDVAENGLWWTGRGDSKDATMMSSRNGSASGNLASLVHSRSPCIDYAEVDLWYETILRIGVNWKSYWTASDSTEEELQSLHDTFSKARAHILRALLKASEHLLKWPGRPLTGADDVRFLLIILANPIIHKAARVHPKDETIPINLVNDQDPGLEQSANFDQRHSFSVLKRVLGLLSNLPTETHRYLSSWFSRFPEQRLVQLIDLSQLFISYRLSRQNDNKPTTSSTNSGLIPGLAGTSAETSAQLHAALGLADKAKGGVESSTKFPQYSSDWQIKSAARILALLFSANRTFQGDRRASPSSRLPTGRSSRRQLLETAYFYNTMVDFTELIADFDTWETAQGRFTFCQYPFLLSIAAKIRILEYDTRRQMDIKAREAFFNSILRNKAIEHYLTLRVRRECLVEDSMKAISQVVGTGQQDIKKELKIQFADEEGLDAGGLKKEWFLLLIREIFDPQHGLFIYDEESHFCYFNPHSFETSDQYFLVGVLLGLAIYNSTILDVALPPFTFKKLLASATGSTQSRAPFNRTPIQYTVDDLAEYRPALAKGLRQLLDHKGDVEEDIGHNFVVEIDRYGTNQVVPLCSNGESRVVTNSNRQEFVDLYVRYLLDSSVARQFEPFKRGFFTVCGGNALSLFQPEEIELLIRGSDEALDVASLKAVAIYENWQRGQKPIPHPEDEINIIQWFWEFFEAATPADQRKLLGFVTGSDRIPAMGATSLVIKIAFAGRDSNRFPIARTCFNQLLLYKYHTKEELVEKLWRAVSESEGFGLK